jgi:hypothetical protein
MFDSVNMPRVPQDRPLTIDEVRLVSDLRIMHAKVDELFQVVQDVRRRHTETDIHTYADKPLLDQDIQRVDEIYLWFVKLREERERKSGTR